jgi:hypothetical protein
LPKDGPELVGRKCIEAVEESRDHVIPDAVVLKAEAPSTIRVDDLKQESVRDEVRKCGLRSYLMEFTPDNFLADRVRAAIQVVAREPIGACFVMPDSPR